MRIAAQISLGILIAVVVVLGPLSGFAWFLMNFLAVPIGIIAWYLIFHRHLERDNADVLLRLDSIANAIRERDDARHQEIVGLRRPS